MGKKIAAVFTNHLFLLKIIKIIGILLGAFVIQKISRFFVRSFRRRLKTSPGETPSQRKRRLKTLTSLLNNTINIVIVLVAFLLVLGELGVNLTPFLTGAGIFGLAIGMGMKDLAADMVAGFFLLLDNQINVGDRIEAGGAKGKVVKIGLRNLTIKDKDGRYYYIPNSAIKLIVKEKKRK